MDSNNYGVGKRILEARKNNRLTREKLAEMSGISVQFLSDIENGRKSMTITTLRSICNSLNLSADYIINGTEQSRTYGIVSLLDKLDDNDVKYAEKLLKVYVDALNNK